MKVIIHRGSHTIGGSCIELQSQGHRIILDLGKPLMERDGAELNATALKNPTIENGILPDVDGLYKDQSAGINAVVLSHSHIDHYGLINHVHPDIPFYLSPECQKLIEIGNVFHPEEHASKEVMARFKIVNYWRSFQIGPFKITPYLMDHSSFGASAFLIVAEGKRIFYSGDFRGHGRKAKLFDAMVEKPLPDIDCLLVEGTTLGRKNNIGYHTEVEVEKEMTRLFRDQRDISFVMAAGSNIDRLVSIYKAALSARKTLVVDLYQYYLLDQLKKFAKGLPPHPDDRLRILYIWRHAEAIAEKLDKQILFKYRHRKIEKQEIVRSRKDYVLRLPLRRMTELAKQMQDAQPFHKANYIYSMWHGYLERNSEYKHFSETYQIPMTEIHTSGHAYLPDLKRFCDAMKPKSIIPIHTMTGDKFHNHFDNVVRLDDGDAFDLT